MALNSMIGIIEARIEQTVMVERGIASVSGAEAEIVVTLVGIDSILVSVMTGRNTKMKKSIERVIPILGHK